MSHRKREGTEDRSTGGAHARDGIYIPQDGILTVLSQLHLAGALPQHDPVRQEAFRPSMTDVFSRSKRSWVMSRIRGVHTVPEKRVRSFLHGRGFRFRLHVRSLPGCPDIVLPRHRVVVFVHGCFWHHHAGCKNAVYPRTRAMFWRKKIDGNVLRDKKTVRSLRKLGWRVLTVWECKTADVGTMERRLGALLGRQK